MQTRLIIAIPNRLLAVALAEYVVARGVNISVCDTATDTREIFTLLERYPANVLVYDPYLPGPGPQVTCCRLRREFAELKVILIKAYNANGRFAQAEGCNPAAVISSEATPNQLVEMIKKIANHQLLMLPVINRATHTVTNEKTGLSEREMEVVELLAKGACTKSIAQHMGLSWFTVRKHCDNIRGKLQLSNKAQIVSWYYSVAGLK